jgi:hypothetical protein
VLVRVCCSWLLATSVGLAFGLIAVSAIVIVQIVMKKLVVPFMVSQKAILVYLSLLFNRFCFFATFVVAVVLLSSGSSSGAPLMLYVTAVMIKKRIEVVLRFIPLQSGVLLLIFFVATVIFFIALYVTLWNVYHELRWMYQGARDGVASCVRFLPSDAVDALQQQFLQWSNFSTISNAALNFFKNDLNNVNVSSTWSDSQRQNTTTSSSAVVDPVALIQTYIGPYASWIPAIVLNWMSPVLQQLQDGAHAHSLYSQLLDAYHQLTSYSYFTSVLGYAKAILIDFSGYSFAFFLSILMQSVSHMYNAFVFMAIFFTSSWCIHFSFISVSYFQ